MTIDPPKLCDFDTKQWINSNSTAVIPRKFWEISVSSPLSLEWCIILSYLKFVDAGDRCFSLRLKKLTNNQISLEDVKKSIHKYNPFLNRYSCFFDDTLKKVVAEFEEKLNQTRQRGNSNEEMKTTLICELLNCHIYVFDFKGNKIHEIFPSFDGVQGLPTIYLTHDEADDLTQYKFLLKEDDCFELQARAFQCILDRTDLPSTNKNELQQLVNKHKRLRNFLCLLFRFDLYDLIPEIYKYPLTANQLASAGFSTDPRELDSRGTSSFYHALRCKRIDIIMILYIFSANDCHSSRSTYRNPNANIISNLFELDQVIRRDYSNLSREEVCLISEGLLHFNKFLIELNKRLFKLKQELNFSEEVADEHFKAQKQLEKILSILQEYNNFFWIDYSKETCNGSCCKKQNYIENEFFYNIIDFSAALFFFDNVFNLKRTLIRRFDTHYLKLESDFFFVLLTYKYFSRILLIKGKKYHEFTITPFSSERDCIRKNANTRQFCSFVIIERFQLSNSLREFSENLETELKEKNIVPKNVDLQLPQDLRIIKDEFMLSRLKFYTNIVQEATFKDMKSVLSIERALQVLGESLKFDKQNEDSISHMLRDCLPAEIVEVLHDLRNTLSHLSCAKFTDKFEAENDESLFKNIQAEMKEIMEVFKGVYKIQEMRLAQFLRERWRNFVKELDDKKDEKLESEFQISISDLKNILDEELRDINNVNIDLPLKKHDSLNLNCKSIKYLNSILVPKSDIKSLSESTPFSKETSSDVDENKYSEVENLSVESSIHEQRNTQIYRQHLFNLSVEEIKSMFESPEIQKFIKIITKKSSFTRENTSGGKNIINLVNRLTLLEVFILEDRQCKELWEKSKSLNARDHLTSKIAHRYMCDYEFQASIEMLILDCYTILLGCCESSKRKRKKRLNLPSVLKSLLVKTRKLYSGKNVRHVLAHGDVILETVADFLDPDDFATELARKLLELLRDKDVLVCMGRLWESVACDDQQLTTLIHNKNDVVCSDEQKDMISTIKQCPVWKDYYTLLISKN